MRAQRLRGLLTAAAMAVTVQAGLPAGAQDTSARPPASPFGAAGVPQPLPLPQAAPAFPGARPDAANTQSPPTLLIVDQEALYRRSAWGRRAEAAIEAQSLKVAADNDAAFAALVADETALTTARATLSPDDFRARAAAFDARATQVREERDAARLELNRQADRERALFVERMAPVLGRLMTERGARVVLDRRTVLIADPRADVTDAAVAALDAALGDGAAIVAAAADARAEVTGDATGAPLPGTVQQAAPAPPASGSPDTARPVRSDAEKPAGD